MKTSIPYEEVFAALPAARRERIKERAAVLIAGVNALRAPGLAELRDIGVPAGRKQSTAMPVTRSVAVRKRA